MARNMIVRLGVDASDFQKKMAQAGASAESASKRIRKSMTMDNIGSEVAKIMGWSGQSTSVGDITAQNVGMAQNQLGILRSYRDQLAGAGFDDYQFGRVSERIKALEYDIDAYTQSLNQAAEAEREVTREASDMGQALEAAEPKASRTSRSFDNMERSGRRLNLIPGFIRRIGDSANYSTGRLERMVRTIRNVSVVSFGLRIARGIFGEFSSIIRNHISQDAALQAQVDSLSASMGQVLSPAINVATNAFSYLMPYIVGVSNAIGQLMAALFGSGWSAAAAGANKTAAATGSAAKAQKELNRQLLSFDQINKLDSQKDTESGGGGAGSALSAIEAKTPAWLERFKSTFSELFNSSEFQAANIGGKIGMTLQAGLDWLGDEGLRFDWSGAGRTLRENFDSFMDAGWGESLANTLLILIKGAVSAVLTFLFPELSKVGTVLREQGTDAAVEFVDGIMIGWATGVVLWMGDVGNWIKVNVIDPIVNWVKFWFGIHSPSTVFQSIGENCMSGLGNGFTNGMDWILQKLEDLNTRVINAAKTLKDAFSFEWSLPHLRLPHLSVQWDPVDNVLAQFFGVTAFPRLSVSWFAKGGILDGAQIFGRMGNTLLGGGERGREAILPLDTNTGWMDVLAHRISQSLNVDSASGGDVTVNVLLDGDLITSYVMKGIRRKSRAGTASI